MNKNYFVDCCSLFVVRCSRRTISDLRSAICVIFLLSSCSSGGVGNGGGLLGGAGLNGNPFENGGSFGGGATGGPSETGSGEGNGSGNAGPQAWIPAPSLQKVVVAAPSAPMNEGAISALFKANYFYSKINVPVKTGAVPFGKREWKQFIREAYALITSPRPTSDQRLVTSHSLFFLPSAYAGDPAMDAQADGGPALPGDMDRADIADGVLDLGPVPDRVIPVLGFADVVQDVEPGQKIAISTRKEALEGRQTCGNAQLMGWVACQDFNDKKGFDTAMVPGEHGDTMYFCVTDAEGKKCGEIAEDQPNGHVLFVDKEDPKAATGLPQNVAQDSNSLYTLGNDTLVRTIHEVHNVPNDIPFAAEFQMDIEARDSALIAYKPQDPAAAHPADILGVLSPNGGIELKNRDANGHFVEQGLKRTVLGMIEYKNLKLNWDQKMRFSGTPADGRSNAEDARIFVATEDTPLDERPLVRGQRGPSNEIRFLDAVVEDPTTHQNIVYKDTIVYDVDSQGCALTVFKDDQRNFRLRYACNSNKTNFYPPFGGETPLLDNLGIPLVAQEDEPAPFNDLIIYEDHIAYDDHIPPNPTKIKGKAVLVDSQNKRIWNISYHAPIVDARANDHPTITSQLHDNDSISIPNLKSVTIDKDRTSLYTINDQNGEINTFQLKKNNVALDLAGIKATQASFDLKDILGKDVPLSAQNIAVHTVDNKQYLVVGVGELKSNLVVDAAAAVADAKAKLPPPAPAKVLAPLAAKPFVDPAKALPIAPAPAPVDCASLLQQLMQPMDVARHIALKAQYIAVGCK